jgi:type I restriction enzyme M protein
MTKRGNATKRGKKPLPLLEATGPTLENPMCADFLRQLKEDYKYETEQIALNVKADEFTPGLGWAKADIVVWASVEDKENNAAPFIVTQGKDHDGLRLEDFFEGIAYAQTNKATLFVPLDKTSGQDKDKINFYKLDGEKLISIVKPKPGELQNRRKIADALSHDEKFKRKEFKEILFACHNVIRNNDKFSPEMAFDEISKVMFVKIDYERYNGLLTKAELLKKQKEHQTYSVEPFYQTFFEKTKAAFKRDEIFEETDKFRIREESFFQIIEKLEKYNLAEILDDVKGLAFEEFLGTTFRGDLGQFFTPRTVVDFMAEILDPQEGELIADPCCGSGGFLIKSFDLVKDAITKEIQEVKERFRRQVIDEKFPALSHVEQVERLRKLDEICAKLNQELSPKFSGEPNAPGLGFDEVDKQSRLYKLSNNCIYGTDAEPRSARTAKMNMIMRGDGHSGVHHHDGLLHVNGMLREHFDIILTNPPFGARISRELKVSASDTRRNSEKTKEYEKRYGGQYAEERQYLEENQDKPVLELFDTGKKDGEIKSTLTEVVFMERCLDLLKKGGRMGIVLPEGFLNTMDLQLAREYFEGRAKLALIASIPQDVFVAAGATVKPSLVFLKRFSVTEEKLYQQITEEVTEIINAKYQPDIDNIEAAYDKLQNSVASFETSLKELRAKLKEEGADKPKLQAGVSLLQEQLREAKERERQGRRERDKQLKEIENRKKRDIVQERKDRFDYEIPIVEAKSAGVTSTGAKGDSDFPLIEEEFKQYRAMRQKDNDPLWLSQSVEYEYTLEDFTLLRRLKPKETAAPKKKKKVLAFSAKGKLKVSA